MGHIVPRALALRQDADKPQARTGGPMLLTVPEASALLRISKWGLYRLIQTKSLKTVHIGKRHLVRMEELKRFIELREGEAGA